jgi:phenylpropionate dioxygenase-like ring-hydroxylating dioxygenase large terminal subunit
VEVGILPDHFLTSEWYESDLEAVFRPCWLYAGHDSEIAQPRSCIAFQLGTDEVIIMRSVIDKPVRYGGTLL